MNPLFKELTDMVIGIEPITPALAGDFFDFFDNRAFTDHAEWSCCYCTFFHMNKADEQKIGGEVKADGGGTDALRFALRKRAKTLIEQGGIKGYLAYADGVPVGWCNANDKAAFSRFDFDAETSGFIRGDGNEHIKAVTCFIIAPGYREKGIATALLMRVVKDARAEGYAALEGYPRLHDQHDSFDYTGPVRLYEKVGFIKVAEKENAVIMRRCL